MIYNDFQGIKLSGLGLGMMRLPVVDGNDAQVDEEKAAAVIDLAYRSGINYFDTAWGYHNGNSERVAGKYLSRYPRESYYLATKFPGYDNSNMRKVKEIFEAQLEKCQTKYFDFYLFHNVYEGNIDDYLDPNFGILDYLLEQKRAGRIRHLGFSAHGSLEVIRRFLGAYGPHMEFCQLQLNYLDWHFQQAAEKAALVREAGLPIWVMEPLRGGKLATLGPEETTRLKALRLGLPVPPVHPRSDHGAVRYVQPGAAGGQPEDLGDHSAPHRGGAGGPYRPGRRDGGPCGAALHRLPLLHRPLSSASAHSRTHRPVQ